MIKWEWIEVVGVAATVFLVIAGEGMAAMIAANTTLLCRLLSHKEDHPNTERRGDASASPGENC